MKANAIRIAAAMGLCVLVSGCATTVKLQSQPNGATVSIFARPKFGDSWEMKDKVTTPNLYTIRDGTEYFGADSIKEVRFVFRKQGYADRMISANLFKDTENTVPVPDLEPLDTIINIASVPQGATITLHRDQQDAINDVNRIPLPQQTTINLPTDAVLEQVGMVVHAKREAYKTSPWIMNCSASQAAEHFRDVAWMRISMEGYMDEIRPLTIQPGISQTAEVKLRPAVVNLNITSIPTGAIVEDIRPGGFGKLGQTELNVQFTYDQLKSRGFLKDGKAVLDLRGFAPGYAEWYRERTTIPLGETYKLEFVMEAKMNQVRFDSVPPGASVYVLREIVSPESEDKGKKAEFKKHLGSTPMNYNIQPDDPLIHGEPIYFEKDGYETTRVNFAKGERIFHGRLEPRKAAER